MTKDFVDHGFDVKYLVRTGQNRRIPEIVAHQRIESTGRSLLFSLHSAKIAR
jgi:hypothetical protein